MWVHCVSLTEYPGVNTGDTIIALTDCMVWKHRWTLNKALLPFCCCSVVKSCPTLCNPIDCSKPASSVLYYLPEFAQTHVHCAGDATKSSYPLLPPSSPALGLSQLQSLPVSQLFTSGGWSIRASASGSVLPMNSQDWFPLGVTGLIFLQSKGLSSVFSSTTVWKHRFFSTRPSLWSSSHICTWLLGKS